MSGVVFTDGFTISLDGYGAGPRQTSETPLGIGGEELHEWMVGTRTFKRMNGQDGGSTGPEDDMVTRAMTNVGAWILGRNMFAPSRGPWPDDNWRGRWGRNPPCHAPTFVLTHYARPPIEMEGFLDRMDLAVSPKLLGSGEPLLAGIDLPALGYATTNTFAGEKAMHYTITRT
jgi:dihydrofolate reductase